MSVLRVAVIGGGLAGLATGVFLKERLGDKLSLTIYEKDNYPGGTIRTTRQNGYIADWGPNGFLNNEPLTLQLVDQIGLRDKLYQANERAEKRFIFRDNQLWEIAAQPTAFMKSGLLSRSGRLRVAMEYFIRAKKDDSDESIYAFAKRRIGKEATEFLIEPMVRGVFGGYARRLSVKACFPKMREMEQQYGSLTRAMLKKKKKQSASPTGTGRLTSFKGGMFTLVEKLQSLLKAHLRLGCGVKRIDRVASGKFVVICEEGSTEVDRIILAVPAYVAGKLLQPLFPEVSELLTNIEYCSLAVVCHGYKTEQVGREPDGFGFLVPPNQGLSILGSIWTSSIFPEQAPKGEVLFRTMIGGNRVNAVINKEERTLAGLAHEELASIMTILGNPTYEKVFVWNKAIPQYTLGHQERLERVEAGLKEPGGIYLAGNAYSGVGINDVIKRVYGIVERFRSV
ncbi:MAG: protoporphyrinogen oxidase [Planctomycetes bacterium]|nr:protoporphyrinogen oxidase [Planctomycetota bacterium]